MRYPGTELSALRRARPLLGTIVEIRVDDAGSADRERAVASAFEEVSRIESLMGRDAPHSDLARVNAAPVGYPVLVDERTAALLRLCRELQARSVGLFDITAPLTSGRSGDRHSRGWQVLGRRAVRTAPVLLDLDGIAKGYAVDRAVAVLERYGVASGAVSAGGDLRLFGSLPRHATVTVSLPLSTEELRLSLPRPSAVATSARFAAAVASGDLSPGEIIDPRQGRTIDRPAAVTVRASTCAVADALTKIIAIDSMACGPCLDFYHATAWMTDLARRPPRVERRLPRHDSPSTIFDHAVAV
jgi:thiamine biosynthesis lipoprotein